MERGFARAAGNVSKMDFALSHTLDSSWIIVDVIKCMLYLINTNVWHIFSGVAPGYLLHSINYRQV